MMVAVAEELLTKARTSVHDVAMSGDSDLVSEYEGMISTGLACLKAAMQANKLTPREEARLRLRYAVVVQEETEELMEAETTLNKAVALCDQVRLEPPIVRRTTNQFIASITRFEVLHAVSNAESFIRQEPKGRSHRNRQTNI